MDLQQEVIEIARALTEGRLRSMDIKTNYPVGGRMTKEYRISIVEKTEPIHVQSGHRSGWPYNQPGPAASPRSTGGTHRAGRGPRAAGPAAQLPDEVRRSGHRVMIPTRSGGE